MNKKQIREIMKETCWGSIAYCCGLEKHCDIRDGVLGELGISKKDFLKLKKQFDKNLFELLEKNKIKN